MEILFIGITAVILPLMVLVLIRIFGEAKLETIDSYMNNNEYYKAKHLIQKLLKLHPDNYLFHWYNAKINFQLKEYESTLESLKKVLAIPSAFKEIPEFSFHLMLANTFYKLDKPNLAINEYLLATQHKPDCSTAYARIGEIFFFQRDNDNALKFLYKAVKINPKDHASYFLMGRIFFYQKIYDRARECFKEVLKEKPNMMEPFYYMATIEYEQKHFDKAIEYAGKELKKEDNDKWFKQLLLTGKCYQDKGNFIHAVKFYEMLNSDLPDEHPLKKEVYYSLGECYEKMNQLENTLLFWGKVYNEDLQFRDIAEKYNSYKTISEDTNLRKVLEADETKLIEYYTQLLKNLSLKKSKIVFLNHYLTKVIAEDISANFTYSILIYINRALTNVTPIMLDNFLDDLKESNCKKGFYISLGNFSNETQVYPSRYPIDLIPRSRAAELLNP